MEMLRTDGTYTSLEVFLSRKRRLDGRYDRFSDRFAGWTCGGDTGAAEARYRLADRCAELMGNVRLRLELEPPQHRLDGT